MVAAMLKSTESGSTSEQHARAAPAPGARRPVRHLPRFGAFGFGVFRAAGLAFLAAGFSLVAFGLGLVPVAFDAGGLSLPTREPTDFGFADPDEAVLVLAVAPATCLGLVAFAGDADFLADFDWAALLDLAGFAFFFGRGTMSKK